MKRIKYFFFLFFPLSILQGLGFDNGLGLGDEILGGIKWPKQVAILRQKRDKSVRKGSDFKMVNIFSTLKSPP